MIVFGIFDLLNVSLDSRRKHLLGAFRVSKKTLIVAPSDEGAVTDR